MEGLHTQDFSKRAILRFIENEKIFILTHPTRGNFNAHFIELPDIKTIIFTVFDDEWIILLDCRGRNKIVEDVYVCSRIHRTVMKFGYQSDKERWCQHKFFKTLIKMSYLHMKLYKLII